LFRKLSFPLFKPAFKRFLVFLAFPAMLFVSASAFLKRLAFPQTILRLAHSRHIRNASATSLANVVQHIIRKKL